MMPDFVAEEILAVAELPGGLRNEILQPARGARFAGHAQIFIADHVQQKEARDARRQCRSPQFLRQVPAAVKTVVVVERFDRLFQIGPHQPDLHLRLVPGERIGEGEQDRRARTRRRWRR